jgi:hypothetical protein
MMTDDEILERAEQIKYARAYEKEKKRWRERYKNDDEFRAKEKARSLKKYYEDKASLEGLAMRGKK